MNRKKKGGSKLFLFCCVYVSYELVAGEGTVDSSYKQEPQMAAINGTGRYD